MVMGMVSVLFEADHELAVDVEAEVEYDKVE
jgi:hypothetical protein